MIDVCSPAQMAFQIAFAIPAGLGAGCVVLALAVVMIRGIL